MKKKALIKDIAEAAGVSSALVSYVLNNKAEEARVSAITARKIKKIAKEMNYRPNQVAKSLKSGKSMSIGLIVTDISNPFFGSLARLIENESNKKGYTVLFGSSDESAERSERLINTLVSRQIDGIIIVPAEGSKNQLKYLKDLNIPLVLIDRFFKDLKTSYVVIDNFSATYQATEYLINKGCNRIAYVRYKNNMQHMVDRYRGYEQALKDFRKVQRKKLVCEVEYGDEESFNTKFEALLNTKIDAVVFATNTLSIRGLKIMKDRNIQVPDDMDVFCFDENVSYDLFYYPVSYVRQPLKEIARESVRLLLKQLSNKKNRHDKIVLKPEIIKKRLD